MKNLLLAAPIAIGLCLAACAPSDPVADGAAASAAASDSAGAVDDEEQGKSRGVGQ